jgi:hypothetical protein
MVTRDSYCDQVVSRIEAYLCFGASLYMLCELEKRRNVRQHFFLAKLSTLCTTSAGITVPPTHAEKV